MHKIKKFTTTVNWDHSGIRAIADIGGNTVVYGEGSSEPGDGPTPVGVLLSSLGACLTQIIAKLAAKRRIEINDIQVLVEGEMDMEGVINRSSGIRTGVQEIRYQIKIDSPASPEQIDKLIKFAENICPVKDTLQLGTTLISLTNSNNNMI